MQCHELENRLNHLLDARLPLQDDTVMDAHIKTCETCRAEVLLHQAMLDGVDMLVLPELSVEFTKRVTSAVLIGDVSESELQSSESDNNFDSQALKPNSAAQVISPSSPASRQSSTVSRAMAMLAVAASLFLMVGLGLYSLGLNPWKNQTSTPVAAPVATNGTTNNNVASSTPLIFEHLPASFAENKLQLVCQSTGRGMATLPQAVRRMANSPEGSVLASHMRPVIEPVGAAFKVLKKSWPSTSSQPSKSSGDTSWITTSAPGMLC